MSTDKPFTIYLAVNKQNGKVYVGKTSRRISERWKEHVWSSQNPKTYFANAIRKHGSGSFVVTPAISPSTEERANEWERMLIFLLGSHDKQHGYNTTFGGDGVLLPEHKHAEIGLKLRGRKYTPELLERMRKVWNSPERRANLSAALSGPNHPLFGKKRPPHTVENVVAAVKKAFENPEVRLKASLVKRGSLNPMFGIRGEQNPRFGMKHSQATKNRISQSKRLPLDLERARHLRSQGLFYREIARQMGVSESLVWKRLREVEHAAA